MQNTILQTAKYCFLGFNQFLICETKTQAKAYLKQNSSINRIKDLVVITGEMRKEILDSFENLFHTVYDITSGYAIPLEKDTRSDEIHDELQALKKGKKENTKMQSLMAHFKNVFDYLFNAEWNEDYATAPHIKISVSTDKRFPNEIIIAALDSDKEIRSMCAYDADIALEPMSVEYEPLEDTRSDDEIRDELQNDDDSTEQEEDHAQWYRERAQDFEFHPLTLTCDMCLKSAAYYIGVTVHGTSFEFCKICRDELQALKIERTQLPERFSV